MIIINEEMEDIINIVKSLEEFALYKKGVSEKNKTEAKGEKDGFLGMLLGTLSVYLLAYVSLLVYSLFFFIQAKDS